MKRVRQYAISAVAAWTKTQEAAEALPALSFRGAGGNEESRSALLTERDSSIVCPELRRLGRWQLPSGADPALGERGSQLQNRFPAIENRARCRGP